METTTNNNDSLLKKGLLWQQKDKLFSRWKERYFVLTKDYLSCFKKATKIAHSDMGSFTFKLNLVDIEGLRWLDPTRKSKEDGAIVIDVPKKQGSKILLRGHCLMDWFMILQKTIDVSKERRQILRSSSSSSLPRGMLLTTKWSYSGESSAADDDDNNKQNLTPHIYALQHTMSEGKIGWKSLNENKIRSNHDRSRLKNVNDRQKTPNLHKRNRISVFADIDVDMKSVSDVDADLGIDLETPSPRLTPPPPPPPPPPPLPPRTFSTPTSTGPRDQVRSFPQVNNSRFAADPYLCTSSPSTVRRPNQLRPDVVLSYNNSNGSLSSSSRPWGRESPVLSQGSAYAKHVLSSPIMSSRMSKKMNGFLESPAKSKKRRSKQIAKSATSEFSFVKHHHHPSTVDVRSQTLPDNRHTNRSVSSEPGTVQSQRFSLYYRHMALPPPPTTIGHEKLIRTMSQPKPITYGLLRFIDSDTPSPEL